VLLACTGPMETTCRRKGADPPRAPRSFQEHVSIITTVYGQQEHTISPRFHISTLQSHCAPSITSGARSIWGWIHSIKRLSIQLVTVQPISCKAQSGVYAIPKLADNSVMVVVEEVSGSHRMCASLVAAGVKHSSEIELRECDCLDDWLNSAFRREVPELSMF
jgi:hypothetical protein